MNRVQNRSNRNEVRGIKTFEALLTEHRLAVERFVKFRIGNLADAQDVLQDVYLTAFQKFSQLQRQEAFKAWLLSIARNKCGDYFRGQARRLEIPIEDAPERALSYGWQGLVEENCVRDTLERLKGKEQQILYLYFWRQLPQAEIAEKLGVPLGTVKSRLYAAKQSFKEKYPFQRKPKGAKAMTKLPELLPEYTIAPNPAPPFSAKWEELMGWAIVPKLGEKLSWGLYDSPSRKRTEYTEMEVVGKAEVHGIEGVEIKAVQHDAEDYYRTGSVNEMERRFVAQLTDTHCRYLAESHVEDGVRKCYTFLDGESFLDNWGFGEDNCGNETNLSRKGILKREGSVITGSGLDVVGRYTVTIGGKRYDTICVVDTGCFNDSVASEEYLDQNGRQILWRRFNRDDWAYHRYQKKWTEMLPENERLVINGETYVHWYDCITDYIL